MISLSNRSHAPGFCPTLCTSSIAWLYLRREQEVLLFLESVCEIQCMSVKKCSKNGVEKISDCIGVSREYVCVKGEGKGRIESAKLLNELVEIGLRCMGGEVAGTLTLQALQMGWQCGRRACPCKNLAYATMNITIASIIQSIDLKVIASRHLVTETSLRIHKVIEGKNQSAEKQGHEILL
ncbi:hypothetical protein COLO4_33886 [Corchorus olitorius]|uniref:Uncharacterized protein n=1 Tax=Corchorus olitorius TaxID=93759 RepID=A0A1R3GQ59_9ROSI|nr:hypothetical protein COLO4_33886 [Corchorus olitorius]